jgi:hypothetical protein
MGRRLSILLLLALMGCASNAAKRPAHIPQPDLGARLANPLFFGSGTESVATIEVGVRNRAAVPIIVRRIETASPGMGQYTIIGQPRDFRETVAPGEEKVLTTFATAYAQTTVRPTEPLSLRVIVEFGTEDGTRWREIILLRER